MTISGEKKKNVIHRKSEIEKKNNMICESESKNSHYCKKKKKYFPPAPSRCYCADKNNKIVLTKPALRISIPVQILGYRHRYVFLT